MLLGLLRLLPSRVGFAERDASRPAFGGSSLVSLTRHTCVGGGPLGPGRYVRPSRPKKSATTPALFEINRPSGGGKADPQFEALSHGPLLKGESSILKEPVLFFWSSENRESFEPQAQPAAWRSHGLSAAKDGD